MWVLSLGGYFPSNWWISFRVTSNCGQITESPSVSLSKHVIVLLSNVSHRIHTWQLPLSALWLTTPHLLANTVSDKFFFCYCFQDFLCIGNWAARPLTRLSVDSLMVVLPAFLGFGADTSSHWIGSPAITSPPVTDTASHLWPGLSLYCLYSLSSPSFQLMAFITLS